MRIAKRNKSGPKAVVMFCPPTIGQLERVEELLGLRGGGWCQGADALDPSGEPCDLRDCDAKKWSLEAAWIIALSGWIPFWRAAPWLALNIADVDVSGLEKKHAECAALRALVNWNDDPRRKISDVQDKLRLIGRRVRDYAIAV